jgi:iron complex transport system substrate-binding protein
VSVVALLPAATDIVIALGATDLLAAVTHECDLPTGVALPRVTSTPIHTGTAGAIDQQVRESTQRGESLFTLDEAAIAATHPDIILTQALCDVCAVSENDVRALATKLLKTPRIVMLSGTTFATVFNDIQRVGEALNLASEAEELVTGLSARLRRVHNTLKRAAAPRPRVAVLEWTDPVYAAGHWVPELIKRAGGLDVLETPGTHSTTRLPTQVRDAHPDVLIFAQCGYNTERAATEAAQLLQHPDWAWAQSIPAWAIDANQFTSRPGPKIVDGVEIAGAVLHPFLFTPPSRMHARRVIQ